LKARHIVLIVLGATALLCIGGGIVLAGAFNAADEAVNGDSPVVEPEKVEELSTTGRDGMFEFTVESMECGIPEIGDQYWSETAQGEFCVATIRVTNVGDEPRMLVADSQKAYDAEGRQFDADDSVAGIIENQEAWYNDLNPGNSVVTEIAFDVPEGTQLTQLKLHDDFFSGGVIVKVP